AAIYLRVSTQDQTTSNQEHELRQAAERAGWQVVKVYKDHGISGAKGRQWPAGIRYAMPGPHQAPIRRSDGVERRSLGPEPERPSGISVRASRARHRPVSASAGA